MKTLLRIGALLLFALNVSAQFQITHLSGTLTPPGSGCSVTVTPGGLCGPSVPTYRYCQHGPYWIGGNGLTSAPGWYTFKFVPSIKGFSATFTGMDSTNVPPLAAEKNGVDINGVFYPLNITYFTPVLTTCNQAPASIANGLLVASNLLASGAGNGGQITIRACDIDSVRIFTNGVLNGNTFTFRFDTGRCFRALADTPCTGDTLHLSVDGDRTGATFYWSGPNGFVGYLPDMTIDSATMADTGIYMAIRNEPGFSDTSYVHVMIAPPPTIIIGNDAPICADGSDTLHLTVTPFTPGETFKWTGPGGFTSTLQLPIRPGYSYPDSGTYKVVATTALGCKDSATTYAGVSPAPPAPIVSGVTSYCQNVPFVPFTVTGLMTGATVLWYASATGGPSIPTPIVPTATPGVYKYWVSQKLACEGPRASITVTVTTTPVMPPVTGIFQYCQTKGPFVPHNVILPTSTAVARWYTTATGGTPSATEPTPNINVVPPGTPGTYHYWVSVFDSGCEGPRTPVDIIIRPKPTKPTVTPQTYCQYKTPGQLIGSPSIAGDTLKWYGPGPTPPAYLAPTPNTSFAPDTIKYYVTETTFYGCMSDSTLDPIIIKLKPDPPVTHDIKYCQKDKAGFLNAQVDSDGISHLNWYYNTIILPPTPVPFTDTTPGVYKWMVSQTVPNSPAGCLSDSTPIFVTILEKPVFSIEVTSPWVCQFDSVTMAYKGPALFQPSYTWTLPVGAGFASGTDQGDSIITLHFDSVNQNNFVVKLRASNYNGFCFADTSVPIKVVPQPTMVALTKHDVCLIDTVQLALETRSDNANSYKWWIDNVTMSSSSALNIISGNSHTGGPFLISWTDTGLHRIMITSTTIEGCKSDPTYDSVLVHVLPSAAFTFKIDDTKAKLCLEDSVYFTATNPNYKYSYLWTPEHSFDNNNSPAIWGRVEQAKSKITLKVTDPYGCYATESVDLAPEYCCNLLFPNAFTPNGDNRNDVFKPEYLGYHRFHLFRIANRWGQTIFESANSTDAVWDGNYNGVPQDMGVYFYFIKYDCGGATLVQKGDLTLIR